MYHIYVIQNKLNLKIYVGQTNDLKRRWAEHRSYASANSKPNHPLYNSMRKYGSDSFSMQIVESFETVEEANEAEDFWIQFFQSRNREYGYNIAPGGSNREFSPETIKKLSEMNSGKGNPFYGKTHTQETRNHLSALHTGMTASEETRQKMSESHAGENNVMYGKNHTEQSKKLISSNRLQLFVEGKGTSTTKLTWEKVGEIRKSFAEKCMTAKQLAEKYGVTERHIYSIVNNRKWCI